MSLISQFFGVSQTSRANAPANTAATEAASSDAKGSAYLSSLSPGETVEGKIRQVNGSDVRIELPGGGTVNARMDNAMALTEGQTVTFEVRSGSSSQVSLSPLFTNMSMGATAQKALMAAQMPVNATTLKMAVTMMNEGMSIDKNSLGNMFNAISAHSGADIQNLVEMKSLGLSMDPQTIEQYGAFKNYENQIAEGLSDIAEGAVALYEELSGTEGMSPEALQYMEKLTEILARSGEQGPGEIVNTGEAADGTSGTISPKNVPANPENPEAAKGEGTPGQISRDIAGLGAELRELLAGSNKSEALQENKVIPGEKALSEGEAVKEQSATEKNAEALKQLHKEMAALPDHEAGHLQRDLAELVSRQEGGAALAERILHMDPTDSNMLKLSKELLQALDPSKNGIPDKELASRLKELFSGNDFKEVVKGAMKEGLMLRPEEVADKSNVEGLYRKLGNQVKDLTQMLGQIAKPESAFAQSLGNMSNNLDFMNQMNQAMQYVQLPLKMHGSEATGDLYVYSDKKSLASGEGKVSALLHLDMQHMGSVDVYAAISPGNHVSTKFYLESDEMIDFIADHIHILNERLEKRGYSAKAEITTHSADDADSAQVRRIRENAGAGLLAKQSFDVRA